MKKCPNCCNNSPQENNVCNHCGYSFEGKNNTVFTSVGTTYNNGKKVFKKNINKLDVAPRKMNKVALKVILYIFMFYYVISMVINLTDEYKYTDYEPQTIYTCYSLCDDASYVEFNNNCICDNDNIYNKNTGEMIYDSSIDMSVNSDTLAKCRLYCGASVVNFNSDTCICTDGRLYDFSGNEVFAEIQNHRTVYEWYGDVKSGDTAVVTVLCKNNNSSCLGHKYKMDDLAFRYKLNYYFFNLDLLDEEEQSLLLDTYELQLFEITKSVPYTFVIKNDVLKSQFSNYTDISIIENTLIEDGTIER